MSTWNLAHETTNAPISPRLQQCIEATAYPQLLQQLQEHHGAAFALLTCYNDEQLNYEGAWSRAIKNRNFSARANFSQIPSRR
jgi:hypothetical protein